MKRHNDDRDRWDANWKAATKKPPLVEGGQGRTAREIDESASWLTWLVLFGIVALAIVKVTRS